MAGQDWAKQALCRGMHVDMTPDGQGISARLVPLHQGGEGGGEREGGMVKGRRGMRGVSNISTLAETQSPGFSSSSLEDETQARSPFLQAYLSWGQQSCQRTGSRFISTVIHEQECLREGTEMEEGIACRCQQDQ